jgi:hypothetical protein
MMNNSVSIFSVDPIESHDGTISVLGTLPQMAEALANDWPSGGPTFLAALGALVEERAGCHGTVRRAFLLAAVDADFLPDSSMKI